MATAYLYKFSKRRNSTALPPLSSGRAVSLVLKDGTSLTDPTFILSGSALPDENYIQFEGRFYHVLEITSIRQGIWGFNCHVDVLATYKANILAASAFVAYDQTVNTEITDKRLSLKTNAVRVDNAGNAFDFIGRGTTVIINVVGETACATYALSESAARSLLSGVSNWSDSLFDDSLTLEEQFKYFFRQLVSSGSAADCIKSAYMLPVPYGSVSGSIQDIYLGRFNTEVQGKLITNRGYQDSATVTIPWQASDWRRNAPYHEIYLYIPMIGVISYPASSLIGLTNLYVQAAFDISAGDCIFTVSGSPLAAGVATGVIGQYACNIAANYAIGASNITPMQAATSVVVGAGAVAATLASGGAAAAAAAGSAGIVGEVNSIAPIPSSIGSAGGGALLALFGYAPRCMSIFHDTVVAPDSVSPIMGTPTMIVKALAGLTGYVETRLFSVSGDMLENERIEINTYMDGGVYIE